MMAQGFAGSDPGHGRGIAHQGTLRWHPTCHNYEDPQQKIYIYELGGFGEKKQKKKEDDWQQLLAQVPILKKQKKI